MVAATGKLKEVMDPVTRLPNNYEISNELTNTHGYLVREYAFQVKKWNDMDLKEQRYLNCY